MFILFGVMFFLLHIGQNCVVKMILTDVSIQLILVRNFLYNLHKSKLICSYAARIEILFLFTNTILLPAS